RNSPRQLRNMMPPKSWSLSLLFVFSLVPASFAQSPADASSDILSQLQIKPAIIWCVSAFALILSIAAFFVPPARRAMISTIVLGALALAGIWKNWHVGVFDLLSGAAAFSASADVVKGLILAGALTLAILFLLSAYLLVLTWGRGGYVLMGIVSLFGVWGILAHTEILPNTVIWSALPNQMGNLGFLLSAGSTLGFVLSGLVIAFGGGAANPVKPEEDAIEEASEAAEAEKAPPATEPIIPAVGPANIQSPSKAELPKPALQEPERAPLPAQAQMVSTPPTSPSPPPKPEFGVV
ncbi:MAG: hypothetical protein AAGH89_11190, partial [Verrucomicrobiota bacterium]